MAVLVKAEAEVELDAVDESWAFFSFQSGLYYSCPGYSGMNECAQNINTTTDGD